MVYAAKQAITEVFCVTPAYRLAAFSFDPARSKARRLCKNSSLG